MELLGREQELAVLERLLDERGRGGALVLRGAPGVGLTSLLVCAVGFASDGRVARVVGVESELHLPFVAAHQLYVSMLERLDELPDPQRDALASAFGRHGARGERRGRDPDPHRQRWWLRRPEASVACGDSGGPPRRLRHRRPGTRCLRRRLVEAPIPIDLNADVGEGYDGDEGLLAVVTSANVACGFHAGDDETMRAACAAAVARGVSLGAHVGYRDRVGFGRRDLAIDPAIVEEEVTAQILALQAHAVAAGGRVTYVKPHGALYHRATVDPECAAAIVSAMSAAGTGLAALAFPGSQLIARARVAGLEGVQESFADRGYTPGGSLVARGELGALLGEDDAVCQALSIARDGIVATIDGQRVEVGARSICLHGDTPGALAIARGVRAGLESAGIDVRAFA